MRRIIKLNGGHEPNKSQEVSSQDITGPVGAEIDAGNTDGGDEKDKNQGQKNVKGVFVEFFEDKVKQKTKKDSEDKNMIAGETFIRQPNRDFDQVPAGTRTVDEHFD